MRLTWLVGMALLLAGCVGNTARQALDLRPGPTSRPAADDTPVPQIAQQSGQGNAAAQAAVDAQGWKAIEYHTDLPWKAVVMMVSYVVFEAVKQSWIVYLLTTYSHRREMQRLSTGRNGNGSLHIHS